MNRKGKRQTGRFDVQDGMAFVMPDMYNIHPKGSAIGADTHPWLILGVNEFYVEVIMLTTIQCVDENKNRKQRDFNFENLIQLSNQCPPLEPATKRISGASADTYFYLPKQELFSREIRLLNHNSPKRNFANEGTKSLCMNRNEVNRIRRFAIDYQKTYMPKYLTDPYDIEQQEENYFCSIYEAPVPSYFSIDKFNEKFAYEDIPKVPEWKFYPYNEAELFYWEAENNSFLHKFNPKKYTAPPTIEQVKNGVLTESIQKDASPNHHPDFGDK